MTSYISVDPKDIQKELDKLEEIHKQNNQLRASLFNLVVYVHKNDKIQFFLNIVDQIIQRFPCRIIFVEEDIANKEISLKTSIAAKIIQNGDSPHVVCDKIYIETSGDTTEQIHHLILEHVIVDLPIYLLWGQDPTLNHPLFAPLKQMAQRLIFHSECSQNLQQLSVKLLQNIIHPNLDVADLNWIYLEEWKGVLKALFSTADMTPYLHQIKKINLSFCSTPTPSFGHNHFQVHYLHAWLASQLGWKFINYKSSTLDKIIQYQGQNKEVVVHISETACQLGTPTGTILSIQMETYDNKNFYFTSPPQDSRIHIEIKDEGKPNSIYNVSLMKTKWEIFLAKEICYKETSQHYIQMLDVLAKIQDLV